MEAEAVIDFWFREISPRQWFKASGRLDTVIRRRFGASVDAALSGKLDAWATTPRGRLALILLMDQFTRNIHRGKAGAFAGDVKAQKLVLEGLAAGADKDLNLAERQFFYLPLSHAEDAALQALSLEKFAEIAREAQSLIGHAEEHAEVVGRFGRFPTRNSALGRASTAQEEGFLGKPHKSWGQTVVRASKPRRDDGSAAN